MTAENTLTINGTLVSFAPGETILQTAERHSIWIPTLCRLKRASPTGACRVCIVEIDGQSSPVRSCSTPTEAGMVVRTETSAIRAARRRTLIRLLSSGYHECLLCPASGDCRLQDMAYRYGAMGSHTSAPKTDFDFEDVNPFIVRDFSRCIMCGRCVKACREIQANDAIDFNRPQQPDRIITPGDRSLKDSDCVFCGECLQACPTGALVHRNAPPEPRGWETRTVKSTCTFCGVGCQIRLHVRDDSVCRVTGAEDSPPSYGSLCSKGRFGFGFIHSPERLTSPLVKERGGFRQASWQEALDLVSARLSAIKAESGPDSIGVFTSARITNEENYLIQKFARAGLGTNNVDHCARL